MTIYREREAFEAAGLVWVDPASDQWDPVESMNDEEYNAELERHVDALRASENQKTSRTVLVSSSRPPTQYPKDLLGWSIGVPDPAADSRAAARSATVGTVREEGMVAVLALPHSTGAPTLGL